MFRVFYSKFCYAARYLSSCSLSAQAVHDTAIHSFIMGDNLRAFFCFTQAIIIGNSTGPDCLNAGCRAADSDPPAIRHISKACKLDECPLAQRLNHHLQNRSIGISLITTLRQPGFCLVWEGERHGYRLAQRTRGGGIYHP
jgi:hypothetical protein